jgi:pimeloyl-ACP methyl ester carboxylesterase
MDSVISKDGTRIAYHKTGSGPVIILVDGAFCSKDFGPMAKLAPLLSKSFTTISYDRRARGESGDTKPYSVAREIEDIEALIKIAGGQASLFGISSGAILCIHAVAAGVNVNKIALLEPPYVGNKNGKRPADAVQQLSRMIAENKKGDAVKFYLTKVIGVPAIFAFILRLTPNWPKMKAIAPSLPYDAAICGDFNLPVKQLASIKLPAIVIDSTKSPAMLRDAVKAVADALPNGKQISLNGKVHDVPPEILVPALTEFFSD